MDIQFSEGNNFKIKTKNVSITTSPFQIGDKTIYGPGEYEISGVSVMGFRVEDRSNVYLIEADKLNIVFLGDTKSKLDSDLINEIGDTDIVLVCNKEAFTEALRLEPFFIICTDETISKDAGYTPEITNKFSIKKEEIMEDSNTKVIVLTAK
jgi:hypothetical protein